MTASRGLAMPTGNAPSHEDATVATSLSGYSDELGAVSEIGFLDSSVVLARYARRIDAVCEIDACMHYVMFMIIENLVETRLYTRRTP